MQIGVFGGSFDPVHHGHLLAARALREILGLGEIRLIPAGSQPLKGGSHGAPGSDRAAMVELAVAGEPGLVADHREVERAGPSYTVDTLYQLHRQYPEAVLTLCIGSDAAREFPRWKDPGGIRGLARVVVFHRAGELLPVAEMPTVEVPLVEISATQVRARVQSGRSIRYLVPDCVADYIATHRLYQ
jgi:nicotinate-nucleotide adenylyltransferase